LEEEREVWNGKDVWRKNEKFGMETSYGTCVALNNKRDHTIFEQQIFKYKTVTQTYNKYTNM